VLVGAVDPVERVPEVPVGGVQEPQRHEIEDTRGSDIGKARDLGRSRTNAPGTGCRV
jgi:hypothetical protein